MTVRRQTLRAGAICVCAFVAGLGSATKPASGAQEPVPAEQVVLVNLYDHRTGSASGQAEPDWGYSALIRYRGQTILFDGGASPLILEHNAKALGIDLAEVDTVVVSHSHGDHAGGINHVVALNPQVAIYVPAGWSFGSPDPETGRKLRKGHRWLVERYHALEATTEVAPGVHLIHTLSPHTGVFWKYPPHEQDPRLFELPELSLALTTEGGGIFLVVGCSHSGVDRIVTATKEALHAEIALLTGGFHLGPYSGEYVTNLARTMKDPLGVDRVAPTHCTGDEAIDVFQDVFGESSLWAGLGARITFPD